MSVRLSVLVPVFNTAKYLDEALQSILRQTHSDFELLVIDDGSTDSSPAILRELSSSDPRLRVIFRPNRGLVPTRNELLQEAQGEFIAWMDSDDIALSNRFALQLQAFEADPELVCVGGFAECIDPEGLPLRVERYPTSHDDILVAQQKGGAMRFPTVMMRTDVARRAGGFRGSFPIGEDFDLFLRMSELGKMANLPIVVLRYRQHIHSASAIQGAHWRFYRDAILRLAQERLETGSDQMQRGEPFHIPELPSTLERRSPGMVHAEWARDALSSGHARSAWKHSRAAIRHAPTTIHVWKTLVLVTGVRLGLRRLGEHNR